MSLRDSARNSAWRILRRQKPADLIPAASVTSTVVALVEPEPTATQPQPPEVRVHRPIYTSNAYDPEPGQATTAIGYQAAGLLRDRSIDGETTVIGRYGVEQQIARDVEDPPIYAALVAEIARRAAEPAPAAEGDDEPAGDEDHDGNAVLLPRIELDGGEQR